MMKQGWRDPCRSKKIGNGDYKDPIKKADQLQSIADVQIEAGDSEEAKKASKAAKGIEGIDFFEDIPLD